MNTTIEPAAIHRIVRTGQGMGGFMSPPGHPDHFYEVRSWYPRPGKASINLGLRKEADGYASVSSVIANEYGQYPDGIVTAARKLLDRSELVCSEAWIRSVYGYFKHSYSPDGTDRSVDHSVSSSKIQCACGESFWSRGLFQLHLNHALKAMLRLRNRYTRKIETFPAGPHHQVTRVFPPEHHLGYLCVKSYFGDHTPRLDLIANPGKGYGSWPCTKCEQRVQYEARKDAWCVVNTSGTWNPNPDCPKGGQHEVTQDPTRQES